MLRKTRNTNVPVQERGKFVTELENIFLGALSEEILTSVLQTFILYYRIDEERSKTNVYGETERLVFNNPVKIYCFVDEEEPSITTGKYGIDQTKNITAYLHKRRLEELGIVVHMGDYIGYNGNMYLILSTVDMRHVAGVGIYRDTISVKATISDSEQSLNL
jgi:hypothetical protein